MVTAARAFQLSAPMVKGHLDINALVNCHFKGENTILRDHWIPQFRKAGFNFIFLAVSGDRLSHLGGSERPLHAALEITDMFLSEFEALDDPEVSLVTQRKDLDQVRARVKNEHVAFVLALEGGRPLQSCLGHLRNFYRLGFRYIQLTHDLRNELADGRKEGRTGGGLSRFGRQVVAEANRLGMVLDLSHISHPSFRDAIEMTQGPVMVSHANARAVWDHPRNFDDDELRALADKGGVIGIVYIPRFIGHHFEPIEGVMAHLNHVVSVVGIEHVGIGGLGTDARAIKMFGEANWPYERIAQVLAERPKDIYTETQYEKLIQALFNHGYSENEIRLVLGGNFLRLLEQALR